MRKAAIVLGILIVLVVAGLGLAPQLLDLEQLKGPIAAQLSERAGRKIELLGRIGLQLLPSPTLTARDVRLANPPGAAVPDMVRLRALEVKPALLALFAGRFEVRSAILVEPEIDIERLPNGEVNWRAAAPLPAPPATTSRGEPGAPRPAMVPAFAIGGLTIRNGAVTDRSRDGVERFEHINGNVRLDDVTGQLSAAGNLVARGAAVAFQLHAGVLTSTKVPLQLTITTTPMAQLQLDVVFSGTGDDRRVNGKIKLSAADARAVSGTLAQLALPGVLAQPVSLSADISASLQQLALDHLSVDVGPAHGDGSFRLDAGSIPALGLVLSIGRLDLDHWPTPRQAALAPISLIAGAFAAAPQATASPAPPIASAFALPSALNVKLDLGIDSVIWRGGLVRDARLKLALVDGAVTLEHCTASLPGGSDVSLRGSGSMSATGPRGEGIAEANADDLRSLFGWFGVSFGGVPSDRLRTARLSSRFMLGGNRLELAAIDAVVDITHLNGAATVLLQQRPGIGLRLTADRFNVDAYLPPATAADGNRPATPAAAGIPAAHPAATLEGLAAFDANVEARVHSLTWHGQPLGEVHLTGTLENDEATIRELSIGDVGGASASLSGVVAGLGVAPAGQLAFDMHGPELEHVLRLAAPQLASGRSYGAFNLGGGIQVESDTVTLDTDLQLLEGHAHVVGDIARPSGKLDLGFDVDHPSFGRLVRRFAPGISPTDGDPGPVKLAGRVSGEGQRYTVERVALAIGPGTLEGKLGVDLSGARPRIGADITVGDWAVDRLLPSRQLLSLGDVDLALTGHSLVYGRWHLDKPAMAVSVSDGALSLKQLSGGLFGGTLEASGDLSGAATPALQARLVLRDADLKQALHDAAGLGLVDGHFDVDATIAGSGGSGAEMAASLTGGATLHGHGGSISGVALKAMNDQLAQHPADLLTLLRGGAGGRTAFSMLDGTFRLVDGVARCDDLHLVAEGGDGMATVSIDLPKGTIASKIDFRLAAAANAPPLVMHVNGPLDQLRIALDINPLEKFLSQMGPRP